MALIQVRETELKEMEFDKEVAISLYDKYAKEAFELLKDFVFLHPSYLQKEELFLLEVPNLILVHHHLEPKLDNLYTNFPYPIVQ